MDSVYAPRFFIAGVSPFGHPRIYAYLQLPAAFRSLSRPSSAPNAKAFSVCSSSLELLNRTVCSRFFVLRSNCCVSYLQFLWQNCFFYPLRKNLISSRSGISSLLSIPSCFPYFVCHVCHTNSFSQKNLYDDSYSVFNEHPTLLRVS